MSEVRSLAVARAKINSQIAAHAPLGVHILGLLVTEFEAAVREDERARFVPQPGVEGTLPAGTTPIDTGTPGVDADGKGADAPPPEAVDGQLDPLVSIPEGSTDVKGTPLPETLPASVADSVASGDPLREVSETPPPTPAANGKKGKNANK